MRLRHPHQRAHRRLHVGQRLIRQRDGAPLPAQRLEAPIIHDFLHRVHPTKSRAPGSLPSGDAAYAQTKSATQAQGPNRRNLYSPVCLLTRQGVPASSLARAIEQRCSKRCVSLPHKIHHPPPHRQEKSCVSNSLGEALYIISLHLMKLRGAVVYTQSRLRQAYQR